jgi:hypothetical protein
MELDRAWRRGDAQLNQLRAIFCRRSFSGFTISAQPIAEARKNWLLFR